MLTFGKQILCILILQMLLLAMVGVNVVQWNCMRSEHPYWEIRILPAEGNAGEEVSCCLPCMPGCGEDCPFVPEHDFYRLYEIAETERVVQLDVEIADVSGPFHRMIYFPLSLENVYGLPQSIAGRPPSSEFLCTYRC